MLNNPLSILLLLLPQLLLLLHIHQALKFLLALHPLRQRRNLLIIDIPLWNLSSRTVELWFFSLRIVTQINGLCFGGLYYCAKWRAK